MKGMQHRDPWGRVGLLGASNNEGHIVIVLVAMPPSVENMYRSVGRLEIVEELQANFGHSWASDGLWMSSVLRQIVHLSVCSPFFCSKLSQCYSRR